MSSKKIDPFDTEVVFFQFGRGIPNFFFDAVSGWTQDFRDLLQDEVGIFLPPVSYFGSCKAVGKNNIQISILGKTVMDETVSDEMMYDSSELKDSIYQLLKSHADMFDIDWDWLLEQWKAENSCHAYHKLLRYYQKLGNDDKKVFHYAKKLAAFGLNRGYKALRECYTSGTGTEVDDEAWRKVSIAENGWDILTSKEF